jgi:RHS repeat-associated protein
MAERWNKVRYAGRHWALLGAARWFVTGLAAGAWVCAAGGDVLAVDKNGVAPNTVSLPDGPGSIRGMGEAFEPDLATGTLRHSLTLDFPKGPSGHTPTLSIEYDSGFGNDSLGFGWQFNIPKVQRKTSRGVPRYIDGPNGIDDNGDGEIDDIHEVDRFIDEESNNLIPRADGFYFRETEDAFIRYRRVDDYWEAITPQGARMEYGVTPEARRVHPETGAIFAWLISRHVDTNGNTINYSYTTFDGVADDNQVHLSMIEYGPGAPPWENSHFVAFTYEPRPDWFETGRPGYLLRTGHRMKEIIVGTQGPTLAGHLAGDFNGDGQTDYLNRKYVLRYDAHPHWSLLTQVTQVGADGVSTLPPLEMAYRLRVPPATLSAAGVIIESVNTPQVTPESGSVEITELNGDGLPDLLRTDPFGGPHVGYMNLGERETADGQAVHWGDRTIIGGDQRTWTVDLSSTSGVVAHLADMNADALSDLVYKVAGTVYYFPNEGRPGTVRWGERQRMDIHPQSSAPSSPYETDGVQTNDVNGDKLIDIIQSVSVSGVANYRVWLNLGGLRFSKSMLRSQAFGYELSATGVELADLNGDGLDDVARITASQVEVTPSIGHGNFAAREIIEIPDAILSITQIEKAVLQDFSGDGLVDLAIERAAPGELWYWVNNGNYTFDTRRIITDLPSLVSASAVTRWADLNGNGTTDLIYADPQAASRIRALDIGDLIGAAPSANLLVRLDNGIGRVTNVTHESSTRFILEDAEAGHLWPDPMPFNVDIVSRIETEDSLGNSYATELAYHDGYYHAPFRLFAGFARAEETFVGDATAPTQITRRVFDTGRDIFALRGKTLRESTEDDGGRVFSEKINTWDVRTLYTGIDGRLVNFPHKAAEELHTLEGGQGIARMVESAFTYDDYGNITEKREYGIVEKGDRGAFGDERVTLTEYALNLDDWIVRFPIREEVHDLSGAVLSRREIYYDDATLAGNNFGVISRGNKTLVRSWVDPATPSAYVLSQRVLYDAYGNATTILGPLASAPGGVPDGDLGHYRTIDYDDRFYAYPVGETIHLGGGKTNLAMTVGYDEGFSVVTSSTSFSGFETSYGYDTFGRLAQSIRPGDSAEYPTLEYDYVLAEPIAGEGVINFIETRLLDKDPGVAGASKRDHYFVSRSFIDGLGRTLLEKEEAAPDDVSGEARVVVSAAKTFNARSKAHHALRPFFSLAGGEDLLAFENISDSAWQGSFHHDGDQVSLGLDEAHKSTTEYDAILRPVQTLHSDGAAKRVAYEPLITRLYDENDNDSSSNFFDTPTTHHHDGLGRLVQVDEAARLNDDGTPTADVQVWSSMYTYRADDALLSILDAQGNERSMTYDGLKRRTQLNDANRGRTTFVYDDASNLIDTTDNKGQRITYTYDGAKRILTEDHHDDDLPFSANLSYDPAQAITQDNRPEIAYFYDDPAGVIEFGNGEEGTAANAQGRLAYVWDLSGEEHTSYDARGRIAWVVKRISESIASPLTSFRTAMTYDAMDRVTTFTYPDDDGTQFFYNDGNRLTAVSGGADANLGGNAFILQDIQFTPADQRRQVTYGNGIVSDYGYDSRGRLAALTAAKASAPSVPLTDYRYRYDPASHILAIDDHRPVDVVAEGSARRNTQRFTFDDLYRLTNVEYVHASSPAAGAADGAIAYRYDRIGNMLAKTSDLAHLEDGVSLTNLGAMSYGGASGASGRVGGAVGYGGPHALTATQSDSALRELTYDANGNVTSHDGFTSTWNFEDRLVAIEDDTLRAVYTYDYGGRRTVKRIFGKNPGGVVLPQPDETTLYTGKHFELRNPNQPTKYIYDGDVRIAKTTGALDGLAKRIQRYQIHEGWNLISLGVETADAAGQLGVSTNPAIDAAFKWTPQREEYVELTTSTSLPRGSIVWIYANADTVLHITGTSPAPPEETTTVKNGFVTIKGLQALALGKALEASEGSAHVFDAAEQTWHAKYFGDLATLSDLPDFIDAGQPIMLHLDAEAILKLPGPAQGLHYYHPDHLGSATVMTDGDGDLIRETAFYPFGAPRVQTDGPSAEGTMISPYQFGQKERDKETGLHYFEARYLAAGLGRFLRVDPVVSDVPIAALRDPQLLHAYAFGRNNPIEFSDPDGRFVKGVIKGARSKIKISEQRAKPLGEITISRPTNGRAVNKRLDSGIFSSRANSEQKTTTLTDPNKIISKVVAQAEVIKKRAETKGLKLDVDSFLKVLASEKKASDEDILAAILEDDELGGLFAEKPTEINGKAITDSNKFIDEGAAAGVGKLQNILRGIDLDAKFEELSKIGGGNNLLDDFADQRNDFIKKYLEDEKEENKEDAKADDEKEDQERQDAED